MMGVMASAETPKARVTMAMLRDRVFMVGILWDRAIKVVNGGASGGAVIFVGASEF